MIRSIVLVGLLSALVSPADAQQVSVRLGGDDYAVEAHFGRGFRRAPPVVSCPPAWRVVRERVWVPGCQRVVEIPARYEWRLDACGRPVWVCVEPARREIVQDPGHWEWRERHVPVDGPGGHVRGPHFGSPDVPAVPVLRERPTLRGRILR